MGTMAVDDHPPLVTSAPPMGSWTWTYDEEHWASHDYLETAEQAIEAAAAEMTDQHNPEPGMRCTVWVGRVGPIKWSDAARDAVGRDCDWLFETMDESIAEDQAYFDEGIFTNLRNTAAARELSEKIGEVVAAWCAERLRFWCAHEIREVVLVAGDDRHYAKKAHP